MTSEALNKIVQSVPRDFFTSFVELSDAAYAVALRDSQGYQEEMRPQLLGQLRHFRLQEALYMSAQAHGLWCGFPHTKPRGDRPSLARVGDVVIGRASLDLRKGTVKASKCRKEIASLNDFMIGHSQSLFDEATPPPGNDGVGVLLVTVNPARYISNQGAPLGVFLAIPTPDLKDWFVYEPVSSILALYAPPVAQEDKAVVALKKVPAKAPNESKASTGE